MLKIFSLFFLFSLITLPVHAADKKIYMSVEEYNNTMYEPGYSMTRKIHASTKAEKKYLLKAMKNLAKAQKKDDIANQEVDIDNIDEMSNFFNQNLDNKPKGISYNLLDLDALAIEEEKAFNERQAAEKKKKQAEIQKQQAIPNPVKGVSDQQNNSSPRRRFSR